MIDISQKLPDGWKLTRLGEVLSGIDAGVSPKALDRPARAHELGVLKVSAVTWNEFRPYENKALPSDFDATDCPRVWRGDLLLSRANTAELLAAPVIASDDYPNLLLSDKTLRLVPKREVGHAPYLLHVLRTQAARRYFESHATGTSGSMRNVSQATICACPIVLPPWVEQQRIAAILDQAEALRAKRRHALATLDTLTQSLFLEMFGDPARHGWPEKSVAALASNIRTGPFGSQLLHSEFVDAGIAVLGIDNAVQNQFVWGRPRFITEHKFRQLKRYQVSPGDVLITIMGTCGRCAVVPDDIPTAINTKHLCCITLDHTQCLSTYLHACFLLHPHVLHRLGIRERGAVMPGLNMQVIKELMIPVPPLPLQREFSAQMSAVERLKASQRASLAKLDALFASLQHCAFRGEL
jgi:type I restriction enzyme S subunit